MADENTGGMELGQVHSAAPKYTAEECEFLDEAALRSNIMDRDGGFSIDFMEKYMNEDCPLWTDTVAHTDFICRFRARIKYQDAQAMLAERKCILQEP